MEVQHEPSTILTISGGQIRDKFSPGHGTEPAFRQWKIKENHNIKSKLSQKHHPNHFCDTQLILTSQNLLTWKDLARTQVNVGVLDFSTEAFDKVPHGRLLSKLSIYGIDGEVAQWIRVMIVDGSSSDQAEDHSGVQQGTVLTHVILTIHQWFTIGCGSPNWSRPLRGWLFDSPIHQDHPRTGPISRRSKCFTELGPELGTAIQCQKV